MRWITLSDRGLRASLRVRPGAGRNGVAGLSRDDAGRFFLNVQVNAPPVDGKANGAVIKLLAKRWGLAAGRLSLVMGASARQKVIEIADGDRELLDKIVRIEDTGQ